MFGIDPKQIEWVVDTLQWLVRSVQAIAAKSGVTLPDPPAPPPAK